MRPPRHPPLVPRRALLVAAAAWLVAVPAIPAHGMSTGESPNATVALVAERSAVKPGRPFTVALRMTMAEGWHTYWKNPGDGGLPLRIEWKLPKGFVAGPIEWPTPVRIPAGSLMSYGYAGEVLLPVVITPPPRIDADSVTVGGVFEWLECREEACVPGSSTLDLSLPVRAEASGPGPFTAAFAEARSRMPEPPGEWIMTAEAGPRAISLKFRTPPGVSVDDAYLFVDRPLVAEYAKPQGLERAGSDYRLTLTPAPNAAGPSDRLTGVLALEGRDARGRTAVRVDVPVSAGDPAPVPPRGAWLRTAAFAGGVGILGLGLALLVRGAMRPRRS